MNYAPQFKSPHEHATIVDQDDGSEAVLGASYRLLRQIGVGATGVVYEAEHIRLGRRFAIKVLRADRKASASTLKRFFLEARIIASVQDERVVGIVDCGQIDDGTPFFVTELLQGQDLRARLSETGVLTVVEAVQIAHDACLGLMAVHASGIVHRDVKPDNLFLSRTSSGLPICKLVDFGVAKLLSHPTTEHGAIVGTAEYMAPEQILDSSRVGPQADIYSIGAILFECLSGCPPHRAANAHATMFKAVHSPAPDIRTLRPDVSSELADVIGKALASDLAARFKTSEELAEAIARVRSRESAVSRCSLCGQSASSVARPAGAGGTLTPRPNPKQLRSVLLGALGGMAISTAAAAWWAHPAGPAAPAPPSETSACQEASNPATQCESCPTAALPARAGFPTASANNPSPSGSTTDDTASGEWNRASEETPVAARHPSHPRGPRGSDVTPASPSNIPMPQWLPSVDVLETQNPYQSHGKTHHP